MKCENCEGLGYKEYEHGLIRLLCRECGGKGEIDGTNSGPGQKPKLLILSERMGNGESLEQLVDKAREIIEASGNKLDDVISGTEPDDKLVRSRDTSQPRKSSKSKASKKATKRVS